MGLKPLLLLVIVILIAVFSFQNMQAISLIFFGVQSLTFPLSFWIVLSLFAGIFSSLLVQFFSGNNRQPNNYQQSNNNRRNTPPADYNPPNLPSQGERVLQYNEYPDDREEEFINDRGRQGDRTPRNKQKVGYRSPVENQFDTEDTIDVEDWMDDSSDDDSNYDSSNRNTENFDRENDNDIDSASESVEDKINEEQMDQPITNEKNDSDPDVIENEETATTAKTNSTRKSFPINEPPDPSLLKSREASLYSYQPKEKTKIETETKKEAKTKTEPKSEQKREEEFADIDRNFEDEFESELESEFDRRQPIPINIPPRKKVSNRNPRNNRNDRPPRRNQVYDASYRVISPPRNSYNDRINEPDYEEDWDDEEDWDF